MLCVEFEQRMHDLLDERQPPERDELLQAHVRGCPNCRQILLAQEDLFREIGRASRPALSGGFAARVVAQARSSSAAARTTRTRRPWLLAAAVLSTAAAALVGLTIAMNLQSNAPSANAVTAPGTENKPAQIHPATTLAVKNSPASRNVRVPRDSKTPGQPELADERALSATDVESLERYGQALQSFASQVPQAVDRLDEVEKATPGLRPVRSSFTLAIGTIRRTIPPPRKQEPPKPGKRDSGFLWAAAVHSV